MYFVGAGNVSKVRVLYTVEASYYNTHSAHFTIEKEVNTEQHAFRGDV